MSAEHPPTPENLETLRAALPPELHALSLDVLTEMWEALTDPDDTFVPFDPDLLESRLREMFPDDP